MYEAFFGFSGKPFQLNPDPAFYFESRGHKRAMAYLQYGLHQNEGFIVVTGEIGAGKTTLLRGLLEQLDPGKVIAANLVSTHVEADDILRMVAAAFGVPCRGQDKAGVLLALETFFVSLAASGKRALLIVDEVQNLGRQSLEELRMLSNFQLEDHALVQSFLVGQPEFRDMLQSRELQQLRQRVIASYHLGPMGQDETRAYIEHRLHLVGWNNDPAFADEIFGRIYRFTDGIPRRINTVCDRLLLSAYLAERRVIDVTHVEEVIEELRVEFARQQPGDAWASEPLLMRVPDEMRMDAFDTEYVHGRTSAVSPASGQPDLNRLETRLAAIEHAMSAMLGVMRLLLQAVRQDKSGRNNRDER